MSEKPGLLQRLVRLPWACKFSWDRAGWWVVDRNGYQTSYIFSLHRTDCPSGYVAYGLIIAGLRFHIWSRNQKPNPEVRDAASQTSAPTGKDQLP